MKHKKIYVITILYILLIVFTIIQVNSQAEPKNNLSSFPKSYRPYLEELQKKYPNWNFVPLNIDLDWNYVIDQENQFGKNLVPKSYSDSWKNTNPGEYNVEVDAGWVDCSRQALEYAMDPRNFLNEVRIFQFEALSYDAKTDTIDGIEKILYGTEFYNRIVDYKTSSGSTVTMSSKYSDLISSAGKTSQVSSYHLASRIKQEVGPFLSHGSISGTVAGFEGYYNFYNIGATSSAEPMGAIKNGLQYAKDGKGASQATKDKYLIPWNNKEKAITGGGIFIGSSYIHLGQDTVYLQKFHVRSNNGGSLFWHQYMTNVLAPYSEGKLIYNGYANTGILNNAITFIIPIYKNMPEEPVQSPSIKSSDFIEDNTKVYADVTTTLNVRTGPGTSYETLTSVDRNVVMTRIAKGQQAGELWDKVRLPNGMVGYVFQNYIKELPETEIEQITVSLDDTNIKRGERKPLKVEIMPEEAKNQEIEYLSSNSSIATVDNSGNIIGLKSGNATITVKAKSNNVSASIDVKVYTPVEEIQLGIDSLMLQEGDTYNIIPVLIPSDADSTKLNYQSENADIATITQDGKITAIKEGKTKVTVKTADGNVSTELEVTVIPKLAEGEIRFDESLQVNQNEIIGWDYKNMKVSQIKGKITTNYKIEIYDAKGNLLTEEQNAGTGSKIKFIDESGSVKIEYIIILYGDVNGDGKINSADLLILQRHILEIEKLTGAFIKAGNINKNGKNPSSYDSLLIQRHILELKIISQTI